MEIDRSRKTNLLWVAIDRYRDRHWSALQNSVTSSEALEDTLKQHYDLADSEITCLPNQQATLSEIERTLRSYLPDGLRELNEGDQLIISFSGHGERDKLTGETAFIPYDADPQSPTSWLNFNTLKPILKNIAAHHILVLSDSCFSGGVFRSNPATTSDDLLSAEFARRAASKRSRMMLSSGGDELVQDFGGTVGKSVFMDGLVHALKTPIEPWLLAEKIFQDTRSYVVLNAHQTPEFGYLHDSGHAGGQLLLTKAGTTINASLVPEAGASNADVDSTGTPSNKTTTDSHRSKTPATADETVEGIDPEPPLEFDQEVKSTEPPRRNAMLSGLGAFDPKTKVISAAFVGSIFAGVFYLGSILTSPGDLLPSTPSPQGQAVLATNTNSLSLACDHEAGSSYFEEIGTTRSIASRDINASSAVTACEAALEEDPTNLRTMHQLGRAYEKMARDTEQIQWASKAIEQYTTACELGSYGSCFNLGDIFQSQRNFVDQDFERAAENFLTGCNLNYGPACSAYAESARIAAYDRNDEPDYETLARSSLKGCELGEARSCRDYAELNFYGRLGSTDNLVAAEYFDKGCDLEDAESCTQYAMLLGSNRLGTPDYERAAEYYEIACNASGDWSCNNLASLHIRGAIENSSLDEAIRHLRMACQGQKRDGCAYLATVLYEERGEDVRSLMNETCEIGGGQHCEDIAWEIANGALPGGTEEAAYYFIRSLRKGASGPFNMVSQPQNTYLMSQPKYRPLLREIQDRMRSAGTYNGTSDGVAGPQTLAAARALCDCRLSLDQ